MKLSQEQIEEERAKFEYYFKPSHGFYKRFMFGENKEYYYTEVRYAFKVWLACRESIEILVPIVQVAPLDHAEGWNDCRDHMIALFKAQGFTVRTK